jgi:4-aminobutyrate aminotransferase/(S)-3-amino-2-methylpropionate transaminase
LPYKTKFGISPPGDAAEPGRLGGTYAGSPIACAAALAVLEVIESEKLAERANIIGRRIKGHSVINELSAQLNTARFAASDSR